MKRTGTRLMSGRWGQSEPGSRAVRHHPPARITAFAALALVALLIGGCAWGITQRATDVGSTTATVSGLVADTEDGNSTYWFEYGPTQNYGSETPHQSITINDRNGHPVSEDLTGLDPETKYHYRLCARSEQRVCGQDLTFTTGAGAVALEITTTPGLYPEFDPNVPDYVTRCNNGPVDVAVDAPADVDVAVDGDPARSGSFNVVVPLASNQEFAFTTTTDVGNSTYHVRCLPNSFPAWTFDKSGTAEQKWYITTNSGYVLVFDGNGVPVWWRGVGGAVDAKLLADGTLAFGATNQYEVRALDGSLIRTLTPVGADVDTHEMLLLPNGNYMVMSYKPRSSPVDLSPYGGPADGAVLDAEIQEIEPDGDLVWSWNTKDHVGLDETTTQWWEERVLPSHADGYDIVHMNSIDVNGDSMVISLRHTDGIYEIDRDTGEVDWKLGGTTTPESLSVVGDPAGSEPLGGQHDARLHPNGTLTAFDNGETHGRPPRGVRYAIDEGADTATFLEAVSGLPEVTEAVCCGSARRSASGSWLVGWGRFPSQNGITEFSPDGSRSFRLFFPANNSYRAVPVPAGKVSRAEWRDGMNAQFPG